LRCSRGQAKAIHIFLVTNYLRRYVAAGADHRVHLTKAFGDKRLDEISTEDVQRLKAALTERAPKTVNDILTVLNTLLKRSSGAY
jgi:hypothetical protein